MSPLGVIKQQQRDVRLVPRYFRNMTVKHYPAMILQQNKTTLKNPHILDVFLCICRCTSCFTIPGVVQLKERSQRKPSGCIDFAVIDLMVPCDN